VSTLSADLERLHSLALGRFLHALTSLRIQGAASLVAYMRSTALLVRIVSSDFGHTTSLARTLAPLGDLVGLRRLELPGVTAWFVIALPVFRNVTVLDLACTGDRCYASLSTRFPSLTALRMPRSTRVLDATYMEFLSDIKNLRHLDVSDCARFDVRALHTIVATLPNLTRLGFHDSFHAVGVHLHVVCIGSLTTKNREEETDRRLTICSDPTCLPDSRRDGIWK